MSYGDTSDKKEGIKKEDLHFYPLQRIFENNGFIFVKSTREENMEMKVDYWRIKGHKKYPFDFKTGRKPQEGFKLTYKINDSNKNSFETGIDDIILIFLLELNFLKQQV